MHRLISVLNRELGGSVAIGADTPLLSTGVIDSFALAGVLEVLRAEFAPGLRCEDVGMDNFDTPRQMCIVLGIAA